MNRKQLLVIVIILMFLLALLPLEPAKGGAGSRAYFVSAEDNFCLIAETQGVVHCVVEDDTAPESLDSVYSCDKPGRREAVS